MTEEIKPVEGAVKEEPKQEQQEAVLTPIEQQALDMGWRPKDEFEGEEDEFIDAKEFVRRKPLFDRLDQQGKQLKNVTKALDQLKDHYTKVRETEYNRALAQLKAGRQQAITDGDGAQFEVLDSRIKQVEKEAAQVLEESKPEVHKPDPAELDNWMGRNSWYNKDDAMTAYADRIGNKYHESVLAGEMTPYQVLQKVEAEVKKEFTHKFRNSNKDTAPNISEGKQAGRKTDSFQLDETERKVMENLVRQKILTKEEYIKDLKRAKGLE